MNLIYILLLLATFSHAISNAADESCFPTKVTIKASKLIDQIGSMSITSYTLKTYYSSECQSLELPNNTEVLVATLRPGTLNTSIKTTKAGELKDSINNQWNIRINASYFDKQGKPTLMLKAKDKNFGPQKTNRGGIFYCTQGSCDIVPAATYKENPAHEIAVQTTPRLITGGQYTKGIHKPNVMDQRVGLAIDTNKQILVFQSHYSSFNELRRFLLTELNVKNAVALDGGSSSSFHSLSIDENGTKHKIDLTNFFFIHVPYYINFYDFNENPERK